MQAVGGELPVAALVEMFGDRGADEAVVHADVGAMAAESGGAQLDGGQAGGLDDPAHLGGEGAGENAVAIPLAQPGGWRGIERAQLEESGPRPVRGQVAAHAGQQFAGVGARGLD